MDRIGTIHPLTVLLKSRKVLFGLTFDDIVYGTGIGRGTVFRDFNKPDQTRLDRLRKYAILLDIPKEEILAAMPW